MTDSEEKETPTSWKQLRVKTNLGTLASIFLAVGFIVWQGMMIRGQIDDNSQAVASMVDAVEDLAGAVSLANELDTRTNILFDEIGSLRDQYQEQADVWIEISTQAEQIETIRGEARTLREDIESTWHQQNQFQMEVTERQGEHEAARQTLSDLQWQVDDLNRRVAEAFGAEMASGGDDYGWQISDLQTKVAEIIGRQNAGVDVQWKLEDLENGLDWEIDELTRRVTELQVRMDTGGAGGVEQWAIDDLWNHSHETWGRTEDLYTQTGQIWDMVLRMWAALESRNWPAEYLYD